MAYEPNKYFDYFEIDEGYYPEINESSIKDPKNKWQSTFPHKDIVALLKLTERALSRTEKKSLWIEGSYGTGKSRILWMMKNLLTCPEKEFDAYFDDYENLREEIDLRERLRTIRNGKVVTASRYATGDITSTQKLIFAVFESLTTALKNGGYKFDGAKTLRGKIASWLESDTANLELFRAKIQKPEYLMSAALSKWTAEEIIERLKNTEFEVAQLVEEILKLGEREGILAFTINMKDLIDWTAEVIEENNLKAIVLFWDEFSKFFSNNRNNLDEFQRLAELSNIAPFYLVIATHKSDELAGEGGQAFRILRDRFIPVNVTMPDNIAFELIGHALKVKEFAQKEWNQVFAALRERTEVPRKIVMEFAKIRDEKILTNILPIHPMTAILLKYLASLFASNQRSIFNFIKNSDPNVKAFQDFIATKSPEEGDLLTADYLWNFFYESGTDEHGGGNVGRMNLKPSVRAILDSYSMNKDNLNFDEKIVFKAILLFQVVDQESHESIEIFRPTEKNLELAFTAVDEMEGGRAVTIANNLVRKDILFKKSGKVETFAVMALGGNFAEIERLKKSVAESVRTADLVESAKLIDKINEELSTAQKFRCISYPVTADNFTLTINRITNEKEDYKIKIVVCFARNEDEQNKIYNLIGEAVKNSRYHKLVFIDASSNLISRDIFSRWIENAANEKYFRGKDNALADKMKDNAADCLKEWRNSLENGSFVYYPSTKNDDEERKKFSCQNIKLIADELKDNVRKIFPYSFDDADITDTLFQPTQWKKFPEAGIKQESPSKQLNLTSIKTVLGDTWQMSGKYWKVYPNLNISRLKIELDSLIKNKIEKDVRISFDEIFEFLLERGFMPLNIYAFLTGFLLKEYATEPYRFSAGIDGNFGGEMNPQKLAECIGESMKQIFLPARNYRPKYLEIMSQNQRQFINFAAEIFDVEENFSVEQTAQKLRGKLKNLDCPLWCYVDASEEKYKIFLRLLMEISNSRQAVSISALAEKAGQFLIDNPATFQDLKIFLTAQKGRKIFIDFLKNFENGIIFELAQKIGINDVVSECQKRIFSEDKIWLHDKETAEEDLKNFIVDYKIIAESQKFSVGGKSFDSCVFKWKNFCEFNLKIRAEDIGESYPTLKDFFVILKEIVDNKIIPQSKRKIFLSQLTEKAEMIHAALSDPIKILREKYSHQISDLNEEELNKVYNSLPLTSFTDSHGRFFKNLNESAEKIKNSRIQKELLDLWQKVAGNKLPREWSNFHRTPILIMLPKSEEDVVRKVFNTVMENSPSKIDIEKAIDYLKKNSSYFSALNDPDEIEKNFREKIIGDNKILLDNNDEIRNELEQKFQGEIYNWYPNSHVNEILNEFAKKKYYNGGAYEKLTTKVMKMTDEDAKQLLIKLLDNNYEVGLKLLKES